MTDAPEGITYLDFETFMEVEPTSWENHYG